jgi:hypothetical protein
LTRLVCVTQVLHLRWYARTFRLRCEWTSAALQAFFLLCPAVETAAGTATVD